MALAAASPSEGLQMGRTTTRTNRTGAGALFCMLCCSARVFAERRMPSHVTAAQLTWCPPKAGSLSTMSQCHCASVISASVRLVVKTRIFASLAQSCTPLSGTISVFLILPAAFPPVCCFCFYADFCVLEEPVMLSVLFLQGAAKGLLSFGHQLGGLWTLAVHLVGGELLTNSLG